MARPIFTAMALALVAPASAEILTVNARQPVPQITTGHFKLGTPTAPNGSTFGVNNRYLTLNGKPWLPVMGEIHFVRLPNQEWDAALAKIKASGVDIIATYMFWNYHEEKPGQFDWTGDRDVRRFVQLAAKHGLKVVLRLGPWSHGEARYGGSPDWVVRSVPTRSSDPIYMSYVDRYWGEIANQTHGLLWKDGGPIIGIQLENEFNLTGREQGRQHIADLKAMAIKHGFDVPFYTVTGWDGAVYPPGQVLPVFGGYADEPWGTTADKLPPKETYAFRFDSRVSGNLGAQTQGGTGDADADIPFTPFLGAEFGGGMPTMYRRRPVLSAVDVASMLPVELGSGVNLYGYYMYHGGRNLISGTTLEEKTSIGGFNDLPIIDYDYQSPLGEYGEAIPTLAYLRPFHYFLQSYGIQLAPMTVRKPDVAPSALDDLKTLRWSVRSNGDAAFLFVNNHIRQYPTAAHRDVQFSVSLPGGKITFPSKGVTIANDVYFIWPIGLDLGGQKLAWASAQPVTRFETPKGPLHVFVASQGITPEFAFPAGTHITGGSVQKIDGQIVVRVTNPGRGTVLTATKAGAPTVRILVLDRADGLRFWRAEFAGKSHAILTDDQLVGEGETLQLTSVRDPNFALSVWPALPGELVGRPTVASTTHDGIFTRYVAHAIPRQPKAFATLAREPGIAPPVPKGGTAGLPVQPWPETFGTAAGRWKLTIPADALDGLDDAFLNIDWVGDIGRLFAGETMLDDRFFDGCTWRVGLRRNAGYLSKPLTLSILPLRADAPIYIDEAGKPAIKNGQIAGVRSIAIDPQYRLTLELQPSSSKK